MPAGVLNHIMIDLETMSSRSDAAIVQIGAYRFAVEEDDRASFEMSYIRPDRVFLRNIDLNSSIQHGLHVDGDTVAWWMTQNEEARKALYEPEPTTLSKALDALRVWMPGGDIYVWSHATFDIPIIQHAYDVALGQKPPWPYRAARDVRTIEHLAGGHGSLDYPDRKGLQHRGDIDAWAQACGVQQAWQRLALTSEAG